MNQGLTFLAALMVAGLFSVSATAQCLANAGNDTALCMATAENDSLYLGGLPTAMNGTPPYTYTWSANYQWETFTYTASDFLDDTTAARPLLKSVEGADSVITFYLTVTDSLGATCQDSMTVRFSELFEYALDQHESISKGDSIQLYTTYSGGIPPLTYTWSPPVALADPRLVDTWAMPETTTTYELTITDSIGCQAHDRFTVVVGSTGLPHGQQEQPQVALFPNPVSGESVLRVEHTGHSDLTVHFYDATGRKVKQMAITEGETVISRSDFRSGVYFYTVLEQDELVDRGKMTVQ